MDLHHIPYYGMTYMIKVTFPNKHFGNWAIFTLMCSTTLALIDYSFGAGVFVAHVLFGLVCGFMSIANARSRRNKHMTHTDIKEVVFLKVPHVIAFKQGPGQLATKPTTRITYFASPTSMRASKAT